MNIYFIVCVITVYFVAQIVLALAIGPLSVGSCVPLMKLKGSIVVGLFFFSTSLIFSGTMSCSRLTCMFPAPALEFFKELCSFYWRMVGGPRSGLRYAHGYWGIIASRPTQLTEQGTICVHTGLYIRKYL